MRIFYDFEFLEDGHTIAPISLGMVAEDGRELYAISTTAPLADMSVHDWLLANVVPSLPVARDERGHLFWNTLHPDYENVTSRLDMREAVRDFVLGTPEPELWADYGAYDHVTLCQLFGKMIDLPKGFPMFTHDLQQEISRLRGLGVEVALPPPFPPNGPAHNALADAREGLRQLRTLL